MPRLAPFTLTPAAANAIAEWGDPGDGLRVCVYYVHGDGSRQYRYDLVSHGEPDDLRLVFPEGPVMVYVDRESFMRLWGYVLDVVPDWNGEPVKSCFFIRPPSSEEVAEDESESGS